MAGNKSVFQDAIKKGHNAAWDRKWTIAIAEYRRATAEFPDDASAHLNLAHALEEAGQLQGALDECQVASKLLPHDPHPLMLAAGLHEKLGHLAEAAGIFLAAAEIHVAQKATGKAIEAWQRAAALEPDRTDVHEQLAKAYEQGAQHALAAKEFVALARIYQRRGDKSKVSRALQFALKLEPTNAAALAFSDAPAKKDEPKPKPQPKPQQAPAGPVSRAKQQALSRLAETLLEERPSVKSTARRAQKGKETGLGPADIEALIARAVEAQSTDHVPQAIESYRALLAAGVPRLEVKFNLGLLYLETMRYDDAIQLLSETVGEPEYTLASHFALGQCYRAQGKIDAALEHFIQVTKIVDLGSVDRQHADELISVYEKLAESYVAKGDRDQAESFTQSLENFLTSKGWEDKVKELHQHLETLREDGEQVSLAEAIEVPGADQVLQALALSQEFLKRKKFDAASAECYNALELAPDYLPAHVRLAEILSKSGRIEEARTKLSLLAEVATMRGDTIRADRFYRQVVEVFPDDMGARSKLIGSLVKQGRTSAALDEYLALGEAHARRETYDKAADTFAEGLQLASKSGTKGPALHRLRQRLAEARMLQGNYGAALAAYQELRLQSPNDERARSMVVECEFRLGQTGAGLKDLEELVGYYRNKGDGRKTITVLEGLVQICPKESTLLAWLAQSYMSADEKEKAVETLDALAENLLSTGKKQAALAAIRQIIALQPQNVEEYQRLLQQIES